MSDGGLAHPIGVERFIVVEFSVAPRMLCAKCEGTARAELVHRNGDVDVVKCLACRGVGSVPVDDMLVPSFRVSGPYLVVRAQMTYSKNNPGGAGWFLLTVSGKHHTADELFISEAEATAYGLKHGLVLVNDDKKVDDDDKV